MIFMIWFTASCTLFGCLGLAIGVLSRYPSMRLLFATMSALSAFLMGIGFWHTFSDIILVEIARMIMGDQLG